MNVRFDLFNICLLKCFCYFNLLNFLRTSHVVLYNKSSDFYNKVSSRPHFVLFYTSWCGHCQRLRPMFEKLAEKYNHEFEDESVILAKVDCDHLKSLCSDFEISRYPTLLFFWSNHEKSLRYKGKRSFVKLYAFIENMLTLDQPPSLKPTFQSFPFTYESGSFELTSQSFKEIVSQSCYNFVKFFVPWCSHCQAMSAVWKHLREDFADSRKINIAKIDCTKYESICTDQDIQGFPSLIMYKNGKIISQYFGERDYDVMKEYIEFILSRDDNEKPTENWEKTEKGILKNENGDGRPIDSLAKEESSESDKSKDSDVNEHATQEYKKSHGNEFEPTLINFKNEISCKTHFVLFYVSWCKDSKTMKEDWVELRKTFVHSPVLTISQVDCMEQQTLCLGEEIASYPSLLVYGEGKHMFEYQQDRSFVSLKLYAESLASGEPGRGVTDSIRPSTMEIMSSLVQLSEETFQSMNGALLVLFYEPQCRLSQEVFPVWAKLTEEWNGKYTHFTIAVADCLRCPRFRQMYGIDGFPTILYLDKKTKIEEYGGENNYEALNVYIKKKVSVMHSTDVDYNNSNSQVTINLGEKEEL